MGDKTSTNSPPDVKSASKAWRLVAAGYSIAAVALVAFLTINGASGIPSAVTIGTAGLVAIALLLPTIGMLKLRSNLGPSKSAARHGFALQAVGLLGLLVGVALVVAVSSLLSYLISAAFVAVAGLLGIAGAVLLRRHFIGANSSNNNGTTCLIFGAMLVFSGVGLIVASNIAFEYLISQLQNIVYVDIGAAVSACGSVLTAYSFYVLHSQKPKPAS